MPLGPNIKIIECPRDAMQGWPHFIPTAKKIEYLGTLLKVGFDTIDFGSFVSPKAVPQMADTTAVITNYEVRGTGASTKYEMRSMGASTKYEIRSTGGEGEITVGEEDTKLLAVVANTRGAEEAVLHNGVQYLGFPFSISPTFQQRNTNSTMQQSLARVEEIQELCMKTGRQLVVYLSMGFGNPYGDEYNAEILLHWAAQMAERGIGIISLADTVGLATPGQIGFALQTLIPQYPQVEFGVHLHSAPSNRAEKLQAALDAGCRRFDGAVNGIGGCPFAQDELVGNMDTVFMVDFFEKQGFKTGVDVDKLLTCAALAKTIFI
jgi:hydroxymethylglutaryl-CoA lyase